MRRLARVLVVCSLALSSAVVGVFVSSEPARAAETFYIDSVPCNVDPNKPSRANCLVREFVSGWTGSEKCFSVATGRRLSGMPDSVSTICTNYGPLATALVMVGGNDAQTIQFGCWFGDVPCYLMESVTRGTSGMSVDMIRATIESTTFTSETPMWDVAIEAFERWWPLALLVVTGTGVFRIMLSAMRGDGPGIKRAALGIFLMPPVLMSLLALLALLLDLSDQFTEGLMKAMGLEDPGELVNSLLLLPDGVDKVMATIMGLLLFFSCIVLFMVMSLRNLALVILVGLAPIAFWTTGLQSGLDNVRRWVSLVVALLLAKPVTVAVFAISLDLIRAQDSLFTVSALPGMFGLMLAGLMPFALMTLLSFTGSNSEVESVAQQTNAGTRGLRARLSRGTSHATTRLGSAAAYSATGHAVGRPLTNPNRGGAAGANLGGAQGRQPISGMSQAAAPTSTTAAATQARPPAQTGLQLGQGGRDAR